jgi:hypothetical protein
MDKNLSNPSKNDKSGHQGINRVLILTINTLPIRYLQNI